MDDVQRLREQKSKSSIDEFRAELDELEKGAYKAGQRSAVGLPPGVARAERMAERARALQASTPGLSNIEATRRAYVEAGEKLE